MGSPSAAFVFIFATSIVFPGALSVPFVYFHGIGDYCGSLGSAALTSTMSFTSGSRGSCVEIGNGRSDSFTMPLMQQTQIACEKVKAMPELQGGYSIVGVSQGCLIARGVIEMCDGPPARNFVAVGGPNAGVASPTECGPFPEFCNTGGIYSDYVQAHSAPSGYTKIPGAKEAYLKGCKFLPEINNEIPGEFQPIYKERFSRLQNLTLVMFDQDTVIQPKESSLFGYYADGSKATILPMRQTNLYIQDLFGLKTLDGAGKIRMVAVEGFHVQITPYVISTYIVPYLKG